MTTMTTEHVADLQYGAMTLIGALEPLAGYITDLTTSHQRGLGFLTPANRAMINAQIITDRRERLTQPDRLDQDGRPVVGLDWLNRGEDIKPSGHIRAAGTIGPISCEAEIYYTLRHITKVIVRRLDRNGVCVLARLRAEPTTSDLLTHLRALVVLLAAAPDVLGLVHRELTRLRDEATRVIDGDQRTRLPDPCPHCGRDVLVVHWEHDYIRCDRDPRTGAYGICRCPDPLCECKSKPVAYRHAWHRTEAAAGNRRHTWHALNNLLVTRRAATAH